MFDNLGLGEFFFLALLALLFFGPKRLPQIGAQLGRWIRSLTRYSSAFLNEWRDEALVVHDAVQEVKGIRDEIVAARAEIASTLNEARADVGGAVSGARQDVQQQLKRSTQVLPVIGPPPQAPATESTGTDVAIAKTRDDRPQRPVPLSGDESSTPSTVSPGSVPDPIPPLIPPQAPVQDTQVERLRSPSAPLTLSRYPAGRTLRGEVDSLRAEMCTLQAELAQVRAQIEARQARARSEYSVGTQGDEGEEKALIIAPPAVAPMPVPQGEAT